MPCHEPGAFDGIELFDDRRCKHCGKLRGQRGNVAHFEIAGARQSDFPMRRKVAEYDGEPKARCFEHCDRLAFVAGR